MVKAALALLVEGHSLTREQAYQTLTHVMEGQATEAQTGALLVTLRMKGETPEEVVGFAEAMREYALRVPTSRPHLLDTCGTGGDACDTFNISTTAAFVAAGAGAAVAKHGNRAVSSRCGSADVLQTLGINLDLEPEDLGRCLDEVGIGFLFAPRLHPAMKHAAGPRRELGLRTVFNLLGPLTNPAGARRQLLGAFSPHAARLLAAALADLGAEHALVVHGAGGLDELSTLGPTLVLEVRAGEVTEQEWSAADFGLPVACLEDLLGGEQATCADRLRAVLAGEPGPCRDIVLLNAAAALYVAGRAPDLAAGLGQAADSLDTGAALAKLEALRTLSQELGCDDHS